MNPCEKFQENIAAEALEAGEDAEWQAHLAACPSCRAEVEAFRGLAQAFRDEGPSDPGELFFAAQRRKIQEAIAAEAPRSRRRSWMPALALAAAAVLLFIGLSRWQGPDAGPQHIWSTAMWGLAGQQGSLTGSGILEFESLSPEQLEGLAQIMESRILRNGQDVLFEESSDFQDLSATELEQLMRRLRASAPGGQA